MPDSRWRRTAVSSALRPAIRGARGRVGRRAWWRRARGRGRWGVAVHGLDEELEGAPGRQGRGRRRPWRRWCGRRRSRGRGCAGRASRLGGGGRGGRRRGPGGLRAGGRGGGARSRGARPGLAIASVSGTCSLASTAARSRRRAAVVSSLPQGEPGARQRQYAASCGRVSRSHSVAAPVHRSRDSRPSSLRISAHHRARAAVPWPIIGCGPNGSREQAPCSRCSRAASSCRSGAPTGRRPAAASSAPARAAVVRARAKSIESSRATARSRVGSSSASAAPGWPAQRCASA